jgi:hypothetical protein
VLTAVFCQLTVEADGRVEVGLALENRRRLLGEQCGRAPDRVAAGDTTRIEADDVEPFLQRLG